MPLRDDYTANLLRDRSGPDSLFDAGRLLPAHTPDSSRGTRSQQIVKVFAMLYSERWLYFTHKLN